MNFLKKPTRDGSDEQLMVVIQTSDSQAFEALYNRYSKRLLVYFYKMLGSEEKAQDFLQDIFLKLINRPDAFDANKPFSTWIFSVAANMCKNEYRYMEVRKDTRNGETDNIMENTEMGIGDKLDRAQFRIRLLQEIRQLDADHRHTFLLRFQENFSIKEISQILNCSEGTVKSRLFYITRKLAIKLKDFDPSNSEVNYNEK